jgi:glucan phosphoethanolaminetransferase (alkaline phosphatase superfamily)
MAKLFGVITAVVGATLAWALGVIFLFVVAFIVVFGALLLILLLVYIDISTSEWSQALWKLIPLAIVIFLIFFIIGALSHANI